MRALGRPEIPRRGGQPTTPGLPTGTQSPLPGSPPVGTNKDTGTNKGTVRVRAPDGRTGTWDYSKGPLPPGFKVIQ